MVIKEWDGGPNVAWVRAPYPSEYIGRRPSFDEGQCSDSAEDVIALQDSHHAKNQIVALGKCGLLHVLVHTFLIAFTAGYGLQDFIVQSVGVEFIIVTLIGRIERYRDRLHAGVGLPRIRT